MSITYLNGNVKLAVELKRVLHPSKKKKKETKKKENLYLRNSKVMEDRVCIRFSFI